MATFDVTSLFTSIPKELAETAVSESPTQLWDASNTGLKNEHLSDIQKLCMQTFFPFQNTVWTDQWYLKGFFYLRQHHWNCFPETRGSRLRNSRTIILGILRRQYLLINQERQTGLLQDLLNIHGYTVCNGRGGRWDTTVPKSLFTPTRRRRTFNMGLSKTTNNLHLFSCKGSVWNFARSTSSNRTGLTCRRSAPLIPAIETALKVLGKTKVLSREKHL